ncbi:hypothetical protein Tco_0809847 [Tanacetum coccineum]
MGKIAERRECETSYRDISFDCQELNKEFSPTISAKVMNNSQVVHEEVSFNSVGGSGNNKGGSVLGVLDEMIRVGRAMGRQCLMSNLNDLKEIEEYDFVQKQKSDGRLKVVEVKKSPGPTGELLNSLEKFWKVIGPDSVKQLRHSLNRAVLYGLFTIMEHKSVIIGFRWAAGMTRHKAWDDVILKLQSRLSKWKAKTLSIGGRLTLLKSVLGASMLRKKFPEIAWDKVLASKKKGVLVFRVYLALIERSSLKWVKAFVSQDDSLWFRVFFIQAVHGDKIDSH